MNTSSTSTICQLIPLSRRTPAALRKALAAGDSSAVQTIWNAALRKPRRRWLRRKPAVPLFAWWSVDSLPLSGRERELAASLDDLRQPAANTRDRQRQSSGGSTASELLSNWLVEASAPLDTWERLTVSEILLREHDQLPADVFVHCLALLAQTHVSASQTPGPAVPAAAALATAAQQSLATICGSEAQWIESLLLAPLRPVPDGHAAAAAELARTLLECTDSDGFLHGSLLQRTVQLLTPLTRSLAWSAAFRKALWNETARQRFHDCVERCSMLLVDGGQLLPTAAMQEDHPPAQLDCTLLLDQAAQLAGFRAGGRVRSLIRESQSQQSEKRRRQFVRSRAALRPKPRKQRSAACWQSDVASAALMRSGRHPLADLLVSEWYSGTPHVSLATAGLPLLSGPWTWEITIDGEPVSQAATWNCTCWFLDEEVAFAELEAQQLSGARLIRHLLLSTIDHFALLTDSVTCDRTDAEVQVSSSLTLAQGVATTRDVVTREIQAATGELVTRIFPMWLPDDRIQSTAGSLLDDGRSLMATAAGRGGATLPLLLDWHPGRRSAPADWSRLTVAEARRNVADHEASGFRLRVGRQQWLVYRSLLPPQVHRTVLGLHTADESVYGKIAASGQVESLVQVEPAPTT